MRCFTALLHRLDATLYGPTGGDATAGYASRCLGRLRWLMPALYSHFECEQLEWAEWLLPWLRFLLSRELAPDDVCRLWDTYFALDDPAALLEHHLYTCLAILKSCEPELLDSDHDEMRHMLRQLPPMDMATILAQAGYLKEEVAAAEVQAALVAAPPEEEEAGEEGKKGEKGEAGSEEDDDSKSSSSKSSEAGLGLGRIVALNHRSSTLYQIYEHIRYLFF
jgi:hypothetical protein